MRQIVLARLDKTRPVLILTAPDRLRVLRNVTVAAITTTARGAVAEVPIGPANGLDHDSVVNCDDIATIPTSLLGKHIGSFFDHQEAELTAALHRAFDLEDLEE